MSHPESKFDENDATFISKGTYGYIYKVKTPTGEYVAVKEQTMGNVSEGFHGAALREIDILTHIDHPSVVKVLDKWIHRTNMYTKMPFYKHNLAKYSKELSSMDVVSRLPVICYRLVEVLSFINSIGMNHFDVKPENIMIDDNGSPILIDFGIAFRKGGIITEVCTFIYRPPELFFTADQAYMDEKSDVWALGTSLFEFVNKGEYMIEPSSDLNIVVQEIFDICGLSKEFHDEFVNKPMKLRENRLPKVLKSINRYLSDSFIDFISCMLEPVYSKRKTFTQLLEHPYLKEARRTLQPYIGSEITIPYAPLAPQDVHIYARCDLVRMVKRLAREVGGGDRAVIMSIRLFDNYLSKLDQSLQSHRYYARIMLTCFIISSNYWESGLLSISDAIAPYEDITKDFTCTKRKIASLEKKIIRSLDFAINSMTLYDLVQEISGFDVKTPLHINAIYDTLANKENIRLEANQIVELIRVKTLIN